MPQSYSSSIVAKHILDFCIGRYKFVYIWGNGWSGKSTLSQEIINKAQSHWISVNCIDTDDFMIDKQLRRSATKIRTDTHGNERHSQYTRAFPESYHLSSLESIIHTLTQWIDCFYKPKRSSNFVRLYNSYPLTIIEWVGTAFWGQNPETFSLFITCNQETEIQRRIQRSRDNESSLSYEEIVQKLIERNEQFAVTILPEKHKYTIELESLSDYTLEVIRDTVWVF